MRTSVAPVATAEEVAAIVAALQELWPRPRPPAEPPAPTRSAWRFSGRWWSRPIPMRRERPFR